MDSEIALWILDFLLRQPIPNQIINNLLIHSHVPIVDDNPRFEKAVALRAIESDITKGTVSEQTLESLEIVEALDKKLGIPVPDSMRRAYCALAVECTVKDLGESGMYLEAVERVWRRRVGGLEERGSELVTEELGNWRDDVEAAVWDEGVRKRLSERNSREDAMVTVQKYLKEAFAGMGRPFLELLARMERESKERERESDSGGELDGVPKKKIAVRFKHVATGCKRPRGRARIGYLDEDKSPSDKYDALPTPEVDKVQEALKTSSMELQALVKDPLPDALQHAATVSVEMRREVLHQDISVENQNEKGLEESNTVAGDLISEMARKELVHEASVQMRNGKEVDAPNPSVEEAVELRQAVESTSVIPSCSHQNNVSKPSLMERNNTARTYEWDDPIDGSPDGASNRRLFHLDSTERKLVSPLKKYEITKLIRRRKMKKWSLEEEDALRDGVQKFGKGNWKLILNSRRDIFTERTEVDLKDKWRNMTR